MKHIKGFIIGIASAIALLGFSVTAAAVQITVPSAPAAGYALISTSTGAYITVATTTGLGLNVLPYYASSTIGDGTATGGLTVSGNATTTGNAYFAGNVGVTGNLLLNPSGSSSASPTLIGFAPAMASGQAVRIQFGDSANALQESYGGRTQLYGFWGVEIHGNRQAGTALTYQNGAANDAALGIYGASGDTAPVTEWWNNAGTVPFAVVSGSGNLGIGTTSPYAQLSVATPNGSTGALSTLFAIASSTTSGATTTLFSVLNNGNVGIGTSSPGAALEVNGNVLLPYLGSLGFRTNTGSIQNTITSNPNSAIDIASVNSFTFNNGTSIKQNSPSNWDMSFFTGQTPTSKVTIQAGGNVGIGTTSPYAQLTVATPNGATGSLSTLFAIASSTTSGATTTLFAVTNSGNVGIGTTSPITSLDVGGLVGFVGPFSAGNTPVASFSANLNGPSGIQMENINPGGSADFRFAVTDTTGNYTGIVMPATGFVGSTIFGLTRNTSSFLFNSGGTSRKLGIGTLGATDVVLGTANVDRLHILGSGAGAGNVGIGTTNPIGSFTVNQASGSTVKPFSIIGNALDASSDASNGFGFALSHNVNANNRQMVFGSTDSFGNANSSLFRLVTDPSHIAALDAVSGDISTRLPVQIGTNTSNVAIGSPAGALAYNATLPGKLSVYTEAAKVGVSILGAASQTSDFLDITNNGGAAGNVFSVTSAGNVGIGTTSPYAKLSINNSTNDPAGQALFAIASSTATATTTVFSVSNTGHIIASSTTPTLSSCGTSPSMTGDDTHGTVTVGATGTGCTVTFALPFAADPVVVVTPQTGSLVNSFSYTHSTTAITVTQTGLGGAKFDYLVMGTK